MVSSLPIISLMGPTGSGKTEIACRIYDAFDVEIINVDSAQIYRGMNIGSAKLDSTSLLRYPHHLIDLIDPIERYSVSQFQQDCLVCIQKIQARGKIPLLVGGTMLYFKSIVDGLSNLPLHSSLHTADIEASARLNGWPFLHEKLNRVDPVFAARISVNDSQRIMRGLGVYYETGRSLSSFWTDDLIRYEGPIIQLGLGFDSRSVLHTRLENRFDLMLSLGLEKEVLSLFNRGDLSLSLPAIRCVGYQQMWQYLLGESSFEEMRYRSIVASRQLSKRQATWLRSWSNLKKFFVDGDFVLDSILDYLKLSLERYV